MFKILSGFFWTVGMMIFAFWIMVPTTHDERLERACKPTQWAGGFGVSLLEVFQQEWADGFQGAVDKTDYTCRHALWNMFYKKDYERWQLEQSRAEN
ncbi:MAG: hypothetical protein IBX55_15675 [Methyloprofundus sp.]|uniref:hypothetical protein n=1 Tax=Thiomicrospira sp. TaxID=935 RepID=UPI001A0E7832|nr:hypothetical protein [Methyloprofundus sp.]